VGWLRLLHTVPVDVVIKERTAVIKGTGSLSFLITAPNLSPEMLTAQRWQLPGLRIAISSNSAAFEVQPHPLGLEVSYNPGPDQPLDLLLTVTG
jgi:hypothetical protein